MRKLTSWEQAAFEDTISIDDIVKNKVELKKETFIKILDSKQKGDILCILKK